MKHSVLLSVSVHTGVAVGILLLCLPALLELSLHAYKFYIYAGILVLSLSVILPILFKTRSVSSDCPGSECS